MVIIVNTGMSRDGDVAIPAASYHCVPRKLTAFAPTLPSKWDKIDKRQFFALQLDRLH